MEPKKILRLLNFIHISKISFVLNFEKLLAHNCNFSQFSLMIWSANQLFVLIVGDYILYSGQDKALGQKFRTLVS